MQSLLMLPIVTVLTTGLKGLQVILVETIPGNSIFKVHVPKSAVLLTFMSTVCVVIGSPWGLNQVYTPSLMIQEGDKVIVLLSD